MLNDYKLDIHKIQTATRNLVAVNIIPTWVKVGVLMWSWRESNPRPNTSSERLLHAYLCIVFSRHGRGVTNQPCPYPLLFQHSLTETMSTYFT